MFKRLFKPLESNSFFLFGARGTGKTTAIKELFSGKESYYIDLLDQNLYSRFTKDPNTLAALIDSLPKEIAWVIIDEVQKAPKLLDIVHTKIESTNIKFALTGSSARKLKRDGANLLAGRAFVNHLYPLSFMELGEEFQLNKILQWGSLPKIFQLNSDEERFSFLTTYTHTYLKEEILQEQLIRNVDPFVRFLEVAAQMNGKIINYSKLAKESGTSSQTVQTYFEILQDTLLGTILPAYNRSIRKQQVKSPKFYFFDCGIQRALGNALSIPIQPNTYSFGHLFETLVINEVIKLNHYHKKDFRLSYLMTKDSVEIDLIIERPGLPTALIEIKSTSEVDASQVSSLARIAKDFDNSVAYCLSNDPLSRKVGAVHCHPWIVGLQELGLTQPQFG